MLAQHHRRPWPPRVELGRELGGELARDEAEQGAVPGRDRDRVGVVDVAGVAAQRQRAPGAAASEASAPAWWRAAPATPATRSPAAASSGASRPS